MTTELSLVPWPAELETGGTPFVLDDSTVLVPDPGAEPTRLAEQLAAHLRSATGLPLPVTPGATPQANAAVRLALITDESLGREGYELTVTAEEVVIRAAAPAGLFYGAQTLRQLVPAGDRAVPGVRVRDVPRFGWRGMMLDIARHFFGTADIERFIDLVALYKINVVHLHLSDDQGWRLEIDGWPELARVGGRGQVGGGPGGYLSKAAYREIVAYAAQRYVTIVPEIDLPGHTNAALVAYPELSASEQPPEPYTGTRVGFSSLRVDSPQTAKFVRAVLTEVAELTPGPYVHIGGDEALSTPPDDYVRFMRDTVPVVASSGKQAVGWQEIVRAGLGPDALVQYWNTRQPEQAAEAARAGARLIMSPAAHVYLDMKYHDDWHLGQDWAGCVDVHDAYGWDPGTLVDGVDDTVVDGVEAALWTETITTMADIEVMTFPRLPAVAEVAWTPQARRDWDHFRARLAGHVRLWQALSVAFYRSEQVDWER
ncbi:beta-N-acetylhexosaminidase [Haloactinopolyspora sp.]|uniref:beta-N-acetylhexosaminidase n=1 Tax=Haloactinopolyspora sp. TaxID=1966353 RepID=UPI002614BC51|nr:beta-N-acetylhexosaminidase [Haloactinopolyspora sp.]